MGHGTCTCRHSIPHGIPALFLLHCTPHVKRSHTTHTLQHDVDTSTSRACRTRMGYNLAIAFLDALAGHLTQHTHTHPHKQTRKLTVHSKPTTQRTLVMSFRFSGLVTPDGRTSRRFEPACGVVAVAGTGLHILRLVHLLLNLRTESPNQRYYNLQGPPVGDLIGSYRGRPTQSVMYFHIHVNRFIMNILLIFQYKYSKSCSGDFYSQI